MATEQRIENYKKCIGPEIAVALHPTLYTTDLLRIIVSYIVTWK